LFKYLSFFGLLIAAVVAFGVFEHDIPAESVDARYASAASRYLTLETGARIHYRDEGKPDGLPLVLIHGSNASLHTWEPWVATLGDEYRIVSLDLPGHGLTGQTPEDDYTSEAYMDVVQALTRHLALPAFALGGNSMGGGVAWRYTLRHPREVVALILVDASGPADWREVVGPAEASTSAENGGAEADTPGESPLAFRLLRQSWFQSVARYVDPAYLVSQGLKSSYANPALVSDALIERYYTLNMRAGTRAATLKRFSQSRGNSPAETSLNKIRVPTLILWGDTDTLIPVVVGERFAATIPDSTLVVYEHVGHLPMEEVPKRSAADVRIFLRSLRSEEGGSFLPGVEAASPNETSDNSGE
jgi:pimeloyl-ACP methyl ester carboxylesterase